ncbi:MAG TPA: cupin domain-containing protein [Marmoricola sp.]|nr:cupin domain-containing protein [Marmoricola sp.]
MTQIINLPVMAAEQLAVARTSGAGRAAQTIPHAAAAKLRQTVLALVEGQALGEHDSPGEATLQVLVGRVRLTEGPDEWEAGEGDRLVIPPMRHNLAALEDAAVLLTVVRH